MNIMFIELPSLIGGATESGRQTILSEPNMGLIYMATYLKSKTDANVLVLDMVANKINFSNISNAVKDFQPSIVCISAKTFNILAAYKLSSIIKNISSKTVIIIGGAHPTALPEHTLNECHDIDIVALREGENTVVELYERLKNGYNLSNADLFVEIDGIVYRDKFEQIVRNKDRSLITDLDSLPFPDFSLVDYKRYRKLYNPNKHTLQHVYPIFASRGCPFNCTFCMPLHTRKHRVRSIENILDEIELLNKKYGTKRIHFDDSLFCSKKEWFTMFCEKYAERGLSKKVQWGFEIRIDTASREMFKQAKDVGCIYTFFGVESGSEKVLKKANKGYSKDSIIEKVTAAKQAGIDSVNISVILGLPYETKETIEETLKLIEKLPCDGVGINILDIYPGTEVFKMADNGEGGLRWLEGKRMNWSAYSRGTPMAEVNDLSSRDLLTLREQGLEIAVKKSKKNKMTYHLKRQLSNAIEYARTDRQFLFKKIKNTLSRTR